MTVCQVFHIDEPLSRTGMVLDEQEQWSTGHGRRKVDASDQPYNCLPHIMQTIPSIITEEVKLDLNQKYGLVEN